MFIGSAYERLGAPTRRDDDVRDAENQVVTSVKKRERESVSRASAGRQRRSGLLQSPERIFGSAPSVGCAAPTKTTLHTDLLLDEATMGWVRG